MRPTRLIYIENDPALRKILGEILSRSPHLEIIGSFSNGNEVTDRSLIGRADVALIDFSLDQNGLNGVELGIALRNINEYLGIVIYSQFSVKSMINRVPKAMRSGWSFFDKSTEMEMDDYAQILIHTASGRGNWENFAQVGHQNLDAESSIYFQLTPRQRSIMTLASQGLGAKEIALQMGITYPYVRKELSRAYAVLVPSAKEGDDLKTAAILRYLELMNLA